MTVIRVEAGPQAYDVMVGPVEAGLERIIDMARNCAPLLVSEPRVFALHGHRIAEALGARPFLVPEGEAAKSWPALHDVLEAFAERNVTRDTLVVALGGGSVGDLTGLAASLFKRGCPVIHVPTTLLSQADSAIGGKTAIDAFGEKNLVGTFHQPALVIADPGFLDSLDARQLRSGYAEVVKYGLIDDPSFFAWCENNGRGVLAGHRDLRRDAVITAARNKARIVSADVEDRQGKRALLNLGHSFGHAIEAAAGVGSILHGEAVAIGMAFAFRLSAELGHCPTSDADRVTAHLEAAGLPTRLAGLGIKGRDLLAWMARDKKNAGNALALVLVRGIGKAFLDRSVDARRLAAFLEQAS
jgi:3-dehydroquinate synthase